jgi:hypothetical protein
MSASESFQYALLKLAEKLQKMNPEDQKQFVERILQPLEIEYDTEDIALQKEKTDDKKKESVNE